MGSDPIMSGSLTLLGFGGVVDGASCGDGREGTRKAGNQAGGGRSLKRKSRHSGKFWLSTPMVRPDPVFGPGHQVGFDDLEGAARGRVFVSREW